MSICCKAIRQIYYNAGSGYTVASYMTNEDLPEEVKKQKNGNYGIFQAFGTELPTNEGLDVELTGDWKPTKYGMQYSVSDFSVTMPTTKEGIRTYLSSSLIKGIGPAMAARIVETFGEDTLNVFNDSPEKLLQVKGITQKRLDDILEGYQKSSSIRELMMYLSPFGVTPAKVSKIQEKFGPAAVMIVKEEPFRLCEVHGFGFLTVDQIAVKAKHFRADDPLRIKAAILHIMSEAEGEGHLYLKREDIIERVEKLLNHNKDVSPVSERAIRDTGNDMIHTDGSLVCHDGGFYTRKSFQAELGAAAALVRLHMQTGMAVNVDRILRKIQKEQDIILNAKQQVAVKNVFENPVSIITGGPGRGKTTVIRFIIAVQEALDKNAVILLCAPTGIARRRMRECTEYPALTIHKSIGLTGEAGEEEWKNEQPIPDDLIIADEFSMVDMYLADKLFSSIKSGARLVLVGDKDQIESVGPGKVFQEIIDSGVFPVTVLDECFRQEGNSTISQNAIKINKNQLDLVFDDTFQFIPASTPEEASRKIQKIYRKEVLQRNGSLEEVQVMSPLRKDTEAGTDALNLVLRDIANPKRFGYPEITNGRNTYREGDRVMQTKNNDEVANGDIGEVIGIFRKDQKMVMRVDFGDGADYELIDTLKLLMPVIDEAGKAADDMERYLATNHILLMIWKYFAEIIDEIEKNSTENEEQKPEQEEREGQEENPNESEEEPEEEKQGNTGSQTEQNEDKIRKEDTEQESETEDKTERNGKDQETEDPENGRTAELQKFLQQLCENLPKCVRESGGFEDKQNECGIPASETEASSDNALQKILYEMAKETLDEKIQKEIFEHLQKELMEIPFEEGHDLVQKKLCRKTEISDFLKLLTEKYEGQLEQVKKRLRLKLLPILKNQKERTEHKLFLGRRVDLRNIAAPSGAVFKKQQPGKKLDICVAVLVDNSFSMCGERMDHAILAALCLYDFCMESEIPVLVCGHHTDGYRHENLKDETVYLHCCADFETDEKDRFRIAGMQPYGSNRDGTALWYAGSRLLERPEKQKLLFVISDGAPNANQYGGTGAKRDLQKIRKKLLQQGVFFQAAAIGSDKEAIQEIYEESFLDITDLEQLPALLTKKLLRFIRR